MRWLVMPFLRYADFNGRSGRLEFWTFFGISVSAVFIAVVATVFLPELADSGQMPQSSPPVAKASPVGAIGYVVWWLVSIVPWFAIQIRRFHDQGRSGWLSIIGAGGYVAVGFGAMPLAVIFFFIAMGLMALPGEEAENRFGPPVDEVEVLEATAGDLGQIPTCAKLVDVGTVAPAFIDTSTTLEMQSDSTERQRELQATETLPTADANSLGGLETAWSTSASSVENDAEHHNNSSDLSSLPDDVKITDNGRYSCRGYVFDSPSAAISYSRRRSTPAPSLKNAYSAELDDNRPRRGVIDPDHTMQERVDIPASVGVPPSDLSSLPDDVKITDNGRYSCRGYVFDSPSAAISYSRRRSTPAPSLKNAYSAELDDNRPRRGVIDPDHTMQERVDHAVSAGVLPSYFPDDVKPEGSGRFSCGGYTFNSLEQALSFAKRRNDRGGPLKKSVSPFSFVAIPKPPQPSPPKVERSAVFGISSSPKKQIVAENWVATPTNLSAGGVPFEGFLIYFGTRPRRQQYERHRSLIDPNLDVSDRRDPQGSTFSYWPNYSELEPEARRTYLEWLSSGRSDPSTPIGYVFIYFYGLERRLVKDRCEADAPAIMSELRRLMAIYGDNHSFKNYCSALLDMGDLLFGDVDDIPTPTLDNRYSWELPIRLRVYLGRKVAAGQTLDSNDALCWTLGHPMLYPRTPVSRCFPEFCELWKVRFEQQFPRGLSVRQPKARLKFQYRSASSECNGTATLDNLPDVGAISGPISKFELLLGSCSDELDPLSRFLGRNPTEKNSAVAGALLPEPLRDHNGQSSFGQFSRFLRSASQQTGFVEVGVADIMAKLGFPDAGKANERRTLHLKRLPELFDASGFGFEPDKRFGPAPSISEDLKLCVFPADRGGLVNANRPEYQAARTMAEIAALAARADDLVVDAEIESIASDLISFPEITDLDRSRLRAHALALLANPTNLKAATKRLCALPEEQRQAALTSAVRAVLADQRITPSEVRFLEGLYKALGIPPDHVYSRLHSGELVTKPASKSALPSAQGLARQAYATEIDHEKLARLKEETSAVSSMLASIFKEEEAAAKTVDDKPTEGAVFAGLDAAHSSLLIQLTEAPMESDAFEAICRNHKLLPSGAIETINDWAFDALDDYVIEEGELICIQEHLIEPIKAIRKVI